MEKELKKTKKNDGITLITLVITIIVLIILAGVLINIVLGNSGLFTLAKKGAKLYSDEQAREKVEIMLSEYQVEKYTDGKELSTFLQEQKTKGTIDDYTDNGNTITVTVDEYDITINKQEEKITEVQKHVETEPTPTVPVIVPEGDMTVPDVDVPTP